jgi:D-alanine--poly(phosphoribitol) ligase subunit 1
MWDLTAGRAALDLHRELNDTAVDYPDHRSIGSLFEDCVARRPEAPAVAYQDQVLSYRELNRMANCLAAAMRAHGVHPGTVAGVAMERTPALIAVLLACLKCGVTYLPFDTAWPRGRLHELLHAAGCRFVFHDRPDGRWLGEGTATVMRVRPDQLTGNPGNPAATAGPGTIAYINFTSGSTGRPKGVPIRHRSIARLVFAARYARLDERVVLLHLAPVTFDAATFEIWGALLHGGTCVLYPAKRLRFSELRRVLADHNVNTVFLTTALFNAIVDEAPGVLAGVGTILTGGEIPSMRHIGEAVRRYGADRLVHVYGPTESTTFATYYPVSRLQPGDRALPIGRPIQNTRVYLVADGRLCGPGEAGEIWLGGSGLSPGYLGDDAGDSPFGECMVDGLAERVYRTGDRAYPLASGDLVFIGRNDDQVKINGHRIELGEISHHLGGHPGVRQNHVTVSIGRSGDRALVAFVVPVDGGVSAADLHAHLRASLPAYMIPHGFCFCESLPLSVTGKVDSRALLAAYEADHWRPGLAAAE